MSESNMPRQSVTRVPVKTNHVLHLILTILTAGIWGIFVWLPLGLINSMRSKKQVTYYS